MSSPGIEPGPRPSQSRVRVRHTPRTMKTGLLPSPPPGNRTRPCGFEDRRASATPAGKVIECPCQESNLVFDLRGVACRPSHPRGANEADGRTRTGMNLLTRQGPHRSATSAGAGAQGVEPCPRGLEARCSPRSTPLKMAPPGPDAGALLFIKPGEEPTRRPSPPRGVILPFTTGARSGRQGT